MQSLLNRQESSENLLLRDHLVELAEKLEKAIVAGQTCRIGRRVVKSYCSETISFHELPEKFSKAVWQDNQSL